MLRKIADARFSGHNIKGIIFSCKFEDIVIFTFFLLLLRQFESDPLIYISFSKFVKTFTKGKMCYLGRACQAI